MSAVIPEQHFKDVCKPGQREKTCRYVTAGPEGICCEKLDPAMKAMLDARVSTMSAQGDNCPGLGAAANEYPSTTCPDCKKTSWSQGDIKHRYCAACNNFY
jgi:hypothetical protein